MSRRARGDWQTPTRLAASVVSLLSRPGSVMEPTCGVGGFLAAADDAWPGVPLHGVEANPEHVEAARSRVPGAAVKKADFFDINWRSVLEGLPGPVLVLGNPPWVNRDTLGALDAQNGIALERVDGVRGLDAITGSGNFDVSEYMTLQLLRALPPTGSVALLLKRSVAHRLLPSLPGLGLDASVHTVDAKAHFGVSVDAVLFRSWRGVGRARWADHAALDGAAVRYLGLWNGGLVPDVDGAERTAHLAGAGTRWRSGVKHDCAEVFELTRVERGWRTAAGEVLTLESSHVLPLVKGGDLHHGRAPTRGLVLPQRHPGQDTRALVQDAPGVAAWLARNRARVDRRRSQIYAKAPPFAVFGVGPYSFSPYKVAISALHKTAGFRVVGPHQGQPVLFDDTCLFLGFADRAAAQQACDWLTVGPGEAYLRARVFREAKRPWTAKLLNTLAVPRPGQT